MTIAEDISKSREFEMHTYLNSMNAMYLNALAQNGDIYDITFDLTEGFSKISGNAVIEDSRIIKILRYSIAPSISQMKFGQFFGITSIDKFENDKVSYDTSKYRELVKISDKIADFATRNLDRSRFIWLSDAKLQIDLALHYSKKWTCSIAADQNAQTTE